MRYSEIPFSQQDRLEDAEGLLDDLEDLGVTVEGIEEARQWFNNAWTLEKARKEAADTDKEFADLARQLARDPGAPGGLEAAMAVGLRTNAGEGVQAVYAHAAMKAISQGYSRLRKCGPKLWNALKTQIEQVCDQAAKIDLPLGLTDQLTALALGLRDQFLEATELATRRQDLYQCANDMITLGIYSEKPKPREQLSNKQWEWKGKPADIPGSAEAPGVWLVHMSKVARPLLLDTEQRREAYLQEQPRSISLETFYKGHAELKQEEAEARYRAQVAMREWESKKAQVKAEALSKEPARRRPAPTKALYQG